MDTKATTVRGNEQQLYDASNAVRLHGPVYRTRMVVCLGFIYATNRNFRSRYDTCLDFQGLMISIYD